MKEVKPIKETSYYSVCPKCHSIDGTVNHLLDKNISTKWYCNNCGARYSLKFENGKMFIGETDEYIEKTLVVLRYDNIVLIVEGIKFSGDEENNDEYFYNEHTCPINYMGKVLMIIDLKNNNNDPHGIFKYVGTFPYDKRIEGDCSMDTVEEIFGIDLLQ